MSKPLAISVRVSPEIKEGIEKVAKADGRTVSAYVERLLVQHLQEKGCLPKVEG